MATSPTSYRRRDLLRRRIRPQFFPGKPDADCLVILFHGCSWSSRARKTQLRDVINAVRKSMPHSDIFLPLLPIEFWSLQNPDDIVADVLEEVDCLWKCRTAGGNPYSRVVLVGFSFGSVLLRQFFCRGGGVLENGKLDRAAIRPWAPQVERIVLLAGMNRGWTVDSPVTRIESMFNNVGTAIGHLLPRKPTLFAIRRGAPFLTRTRLQWLELEREGLVPLTVQLLGTRDDIVSPVDNIDLATGSTFVYLEVPESGHFDVVRMSGADARYANRKAVFLTALSASSAELRAQSMDESELLQLLPIAADSMGEVPLRPTKDSVDDVVFVVHGIRDKGYWTRKIARVVVAEGRQRGRRVVALTPSYGYFPMLPFLLPWTRRAKVEWLLDLYVSVKCWHRGADISFIGHSNGTYILANAVESCRPVQFTNVVFAGSVVRSRFEWPRYVGSQVERVLNYVATGDWVVAIFPRLLQVLRLQDLGGAGHDGFTKEPGPVKDVEYVVGSHSAALDERHWLEMADFILGGDPPEKQVSKRTWWVLLLGHLAVVPWALIATIAIVPLYMFLTALGLPEWTGLQLLRGWHAKMLAAELPAWFWALCLMGWVRFLALVFTRL